MWCVSVCEQQVSLFLPSTQAQLRAFHHTTSKSVAPRIRFLVCIEKRDGRRRRGKQRVLTKKRFFFVVENQEEEKLLQVFLTGRERETLHTSRQVVANKRITSYYLLLVTHERNERLFSICQTEFLREESRKSCLSENFEWRECVCRGNSAKENEMSCGEHLLSIDRIEPSRFTECTCFQGTQDWGAKQGSETERMRERKWKGLMRFNVYATGWMYWRSQAERPAVSMDLTTSFFPVTFVYERQWNRVTQ